MKKYFIIVFLMLLVGCNEENARQNIDVGPLPDNYQELIKQYYTGRLMDPFSAVFSFEKPYSGKAWLGLANGGEQSGWIIITWINAKNSYGAYTGFYEHTVVIKNGAVCCSSGY